MFSMHAGHRDCQRLGPRIFTAPPLRSITAMVVRVEPFVARAAEGEVLRLIKAVRPVEAGDLVRVRPVVCPLLGALVAVPALMLSGLPPVLSHPGVGSGIADLTPAAARRGLGAPGTNVRVGAECVSLGGGTQLDPMEPEPPCGPLGRKPGGLS